MECKFCKKVFQKDSTAFIHICVKKRRFMELESPESRFAFRTFQRFYEMTTIHKRPKSTQDFIDSEFYTEFIKFGTHVVGLGPVYPDKFAEFVIDNGVKLKDWTKDYVYDTYITDLVKKEPADAATERSINTINTWTTKNNIEFCKFFYEVSANEAAYIIKTGKISPWVLYLAESGGELLEKFNADHSRMLCDIIEPKFWMKKLKNNSDDVDYISDLLKQAGL